MALDKRETELPSREEIIKMCREVRRDVYRKKIETMAERGDNAVKPKVFLNPRLAFTRGEIHEG